MSQTQAPERRRQFISFSLLALLFLILVLLYGRPVIQNDGISYYGLAVSLVEDGDFDLKNQYETHPEIRIVKKRFENKVASLYSCGFAYLYAPFLYVADQFQVLRELRVYSQNVVFPFSHGLSILLGSLFYGFLSVAVAGLLLVKTETVSPVHAMLFSSAAFIGTPLLFYSMSTPSFAHAADTFLVTISFCLAVTQSTFPIGPVRFRNVLLGFFLAFTVMLRNNNAVIVPVVVAGLLYFDRKEGWKRALMTSLEVLAGAIPVILVHASFNLSQYGRLFATGYGVSVKSEVATRRITQFWWILFHPVAGLYPWSPVAILSTIGLVLGIRRKSRTCALALTVVAVVIFSIRFAAIIFPGGTFGQRLLTHLYIFWVLGLVEFVRRFKKTGIVLAALCVAWSFLLFNSYFTITGSEQSRILTKEGGSSPVVWFQTANQLCSDAIQRQETTGCISFWYTSLGNNPYPVLLHTIMRERPAKNVE